MQGQWSLGRIARVGLLVAACAIAALAWLRARDASERADALASELASLQARLDAEVAARLMLETNDEPMLDGHAAGRPAQPGKAVGSTPEQLADSAAAAPDAEVEPPAAAEEPQQREASVSSAVVERLVAAGFRREDVERFRARTDQIDLARVYLRDRATREGWLGTPAFRQELQSLEAEQAGLRSEFDESLYDWMLFAAGEPNRVGVADVLTGSPAESAGLAQGDVIVRYDEQLMLNVQDLLGATNAGRAGELVAVEVQRPGQADPIRLFLPRGPIGVRMAPVLVEPESRG